jgi:hypothetical protein
MSASSRKAARLAAGFKWPREDPDPEDFDEDEEDERPGDWGF